MAVYTALLRSIYYYLIYFVFFFACMVFQAQAHFVETSRPQWL